MAESLECCYCGEPSEGKFAIHVSRSMDGPEVWLCNHCGDAEFPTCDEIWIHIESKVIPFAKPKKKFKPLTITTPTTPERA